MVSTFRMIYTVEGCRVKPVWSLGGVFFDGNWRENHIISIEPKSLHGKNGM